MTHEELFREFRDWCTAKSKASRHLYSRKFFYVFTCEYCFSHYVTAAFLLITRYTLVFDGWRGYLIAGFSLVWIANVLHELLWQDAPRDSGGSAGGGRRSVERGN